MTPPLLQVNLDFKEQQKQFSHQELQKVHKIEGVSFKDAKKLKRAVAEQLVQFSSNNFFDEILKQTMTDIKFTHPTIRVAIASRLEKIIEKPVSPESINFSVEFIDDTDFRVESNIERMFEVDKEIVHDVILRSFLAIGGQNHRIAQMKEFKCLIGYREDEIPIFDSKLDILTSQINPNKELIPNFRKIVSAKGLPDFTQAIAESRIDIVKLLDIRESKACHDFRTWLWSQESIDEEELKERLNSFRQKFTDFFKTGKGKAISWLASSGIGFVPLVGSAVGTITSFYDKFLAKEVLPHQGALTFINNKLPSIYKDPNSKT